MALLSHPALIDSTDTLTRQQELRINLHQSCDTIRAKTQQTAIHLQEIIKALGIKPDTIKFE